MNRSRNREKGWHITLHLPGGVWGHAPRPFWHFYAQRQILVQSEVKNYSTAVALYRKLCLLYWGLKLAVYRKSKTGGGHMCMPLIPLPGSAFELTTDPELLSILTQNCTYIDIALIHHNFVNCMSS